MPPVEPSHYFVLVDLPHDASVFGTDPSQRSKGDEDSKYAALKWLKLPHSGSGADHLYFKYENRSRPFDVYQLRQHASDVQLDIRSVLIDDSYFYGNLVPLLANAVHPIFLLLPFFLEENSERFSIIRQLLAGKTNSYADALQLLDVRGNESILEVCDTQLVSGFGDDSSNVPNKLDSYAVRLNKEKLFSWCQKRVDRVTACLKAQNLTDGELQAVEIVSNMLPLTLRSEFVAGCYPSFTGLVGCSATHVKNSSGESIRAAGNVEPVDDYSKDFNLAANVNNKVKSATKGSGARNQKAMAEAAKKSMRITDFFTKK